MTKVAITSGSTLPSSHGSLRSPNGGFSAECRFHRLPEPTEHGCGLIGVGLDVDGYLARSGQRHLDRDVAETLGAQVHPEHATLLADHAQDFGWYFAGADRRAD